MVVVVEQPGHFLHLERGRERPVGTQRRPHHPSARSFPSCRTGLEVVGGRPQMSFGHAQPPEYAGGTRCIGSRGELIHSFHCCLLLCWVVGGWCVVGGVWWVVMSRRPPPGGGGGGGARRVDPSADCDPDCKG
jgi:hypothetical protein